MEVYQLFSHSNGRCAVNAITENEARKTLARHSWNGRDPGWQWDGCFTVEGKLRIWESM